MSNQYNMTPAEKEAKRLVELFDGNKEHAIKCVYIMIGYIDDMDGLIEVKQAIEKYNPQKMKILHLTLKKKWFDMILSGEKKEEYREIKPYWIVRLMNDNCPKEEEYEKSFHNVCDLIFDKSNGYSWNYIFKSYYYEFKKFDVIEFRNGYSKNALKMLVEFKNIRVDKPWSKWSDDFFSDVFVIELGNVLALNQSGEAE